MGDGRQGKSIGAKFARSLLAEVGSARDSDLERVHGDGSRHQVFLLSDGRVVDVFLKSARVYPSKEEFLQDNPAR